MFEAGRKRETKKKIRGERGMGEEQTTTQRKQKQMKKKAHERQQRSTEKDETKDGEGREGVE